MPEPSSWKWWRLSQDLARAPSGPARSLGDHRQGHKERNRAGEMKVRFLLEHGNAALVRLGRVEDGRGSLSHAATPRFPSPLIEPDVRRYRIRLSDGLHRKAHGEAVRGKRSRASTPRSPWITSKVNCRLPRPCTLCRRARKARTRS